MDDVSCANKRYLWLAVAVLLGFIAFTGFCVFLDVFFLGRYVGPTTVSPDGRYQAQVYGSNCGATCPFRAWVVVTDRSWAWMPWPLPLNVSPLWPDVKETVYDSEYHPCTVIPIWEVRRELLIAEPGRYPEDRAEKRDSEWNSIEIRYGSVRDVENQASDYEDCYEVGSQRYLRQALQGLGMIALVILFGASTVHLVFRRLGYFG